MFACLYDKNLKALGTWSTYATTKWSLTRKAYEFDELSVTTRAMENSLSAMYIGLHNDDGSLKYLAFSGKPTTKDGMTTYKGTDLRQIFKQQMRINLTGVGTSNIFDPSSGSLLKTKLMQFYEYLLGLPLTLNFNGFSLTAPEPEDPYQIRFIIDTSDLAEHPNNTLAYDYGWNESWIVRSDGIDNVWDVLQGFNMLYDCYIEFIINLTARTVTCKVKRIYNLISFKLSDFNESKIINDTSVTNRVIVRVKANDDDEVGLYNNTFYLLTDDTVVAEASANNSNVIYPPRVETVFEDVAAEGIAIAVQKLMDNRFQGKVEINTDCAMGYLLQQIDLNTFADVYGYNAADNSTKRRLPVMYISEDQTGKKKVAFGRLQQYWY